MILKIPKDLKIMIFSFLPIHSISYFCLTCKETNKLFSNQQLVKKIWRKKKQLFISIPNSPDLIEKCINSGRFSAIGILKPKMKK